MSYGTIYHEAADFVRPIVADYVQSITTDIIEGDEYEHALYTVTFYEADAEPIVLETNHHDMMINAVRLLNAITRYVYRERINGAD